MSAVLDVPRTAPVPVRRTTTPAWWRSAATGIATAGLAIVVGLWLQNGGLTTLGTNPATSLGRLTGLVGSDLLLIQVLLMARLPFVERSFGQDELARLHRLVGFTSFNLVVAHVLLITVGYASTDRRSLLGELWNLVTTYPGMLLATAGTAALVMVVVTSVRVARAKLRYESWHLLHLYAYLGVGLSLPHQLWTGTDFLTSRAATLYWWGAYLATTVALVGYRLVLPVVRTVRHRPVVSRVVREAPGVISVHLTGRHLDRLPVRAGQFFVWRFLDGPGRTRGHPFSLSAAPTGDSMRITVKDLGAGSARLATLRPGTKVLMEGPYGRLTEDVRTRRKVTMIAAGIGVTPMRALLEDLPYAAGDATLVYRASTSGDFLFRSELDALSRRRGVNLFYVPGRRKSVTSWLPRDAGRLDDRTALLQLVPDLREHDVYLCGPEAWLDSAVRAVRRAGVPGSQVHVERFSW